MGGSSKWLGHKTPTLAVQVQFLYHPQKYVFGSELCISKVQFV